MENYSLVTFRDRLVKRLAEQTLDKNLKRAQLKAARSTSRLNREKLRDKTKEDIEELGESKKTHSEIVLGRINQALKNMDKPST
jgi:phage terminase large subunit